MIPSEENAFENKQVILRMPTVFHVLQLKRLIKMINNSSHKRVSINFSKSLHTQIEWFLVHRIQYNFYSIDHAAVVYYE